MTRDEIKAIYLDAVILAERYCGVPVPGAATPARCLLWHVPELRDRVDAWMAWEVDHGKKRPELPTWAQIEARLA